MYNEPNTILGKVYRRSKSSLATIKPCLLNDRCSVESSAQQNRIRIMRTRKRQKQWLNWRCRATRTSKSHSVPFDWLANILRRIPAHMYCIYNMPFTFYFRFKLDAVYDEHCNLHHVIGQSLDSCCTCALIFVYECIWACVCILVTIPSWLYERGFHSLVVVLVFTISNGVLLLPFFPCRSLHF